AVELVVALCYEPRDRQPVPRRHVSGVEQWLELVQFGRGQLRRGQLRHAVQQFGQVTWCWLVPRIAPPHADGAAGVREQNPLDCHGPEYRPATLPAERVPPGRRDQRMPGGTCAGGGSGRFTGMGTPSRRFTTPFS